MQQFKRRACQKQQRLSKPTLLAMLLEGSSTRTFFENLNDDEWSIVSFDPSKREVCVEIYQKGQTKTLSVTLPFITWK